MSAYFNSNRLQDLPQYWQDGEIISYKGDIEDLNNYRAITLFTTIYKIWAPIMSHGIKPTINLLTNDKQCAYKEKSTTWLIYTIKQNALKTNKWTNTPRSI